ncbi:hypothetical protein EJ110_NYTH59084 [Nymphaea thermarum]|nr:hypothetical protein EJ110_NYTH59084 [Nymphaea thermarum]
MMMASDSSLQAHQRMDSMAIDETLNQSSSVMVPNRKSPMEKKRQLKSKATSSFKKRSSNLPQPDKVLSGLMVSRADAKLLSPQSMDHSNFSAGEARASSAAEDPGDQGMGGPLLKDENPTRMDEKHANPDIAVLIDTKLNEATLEKLSFKFPRYHSISNIHLHGQWARIWLLWDADKMQVQESKVQVYWISIAVKHLSSGRIFSVVGVYLHPDFRIRRFQFDELSAELSSISKPHVCLGDFNAVKDMSQKSGRPPALWPCILFNNFIRANQLKEIRDSRTKYSWSNNRKGPDNVQSLIDHCFVSHDWWDCRDWLFSLCIMPRTSSDHSPILMEAVRNHTFTSGISVFRWNGVIIANMMAPAHWSLIRDTINCSIKEILDDQKTYVQLFLDSNSISLQLPDLEDSQKDKLEWVDYSNRPLSRHQLWDALRARSTVQSWRNFIWKVGAPPRAIWTTYLAVEGRLHVDARAQKRGLQLASRCYICNNAQEDINHVFLQCKVTKSLWELVMRKFGQKNFQPATVKEALVWWSSRKFKNKILFKCWKNLLHIILWHIWKWRNSCKHEGKHAMNLTGKALWSYCTDFLISRDWTLSERQAIQTWLVVGLPWGCWRWENGTVYNIHIAVHLNKDNRDVSALVREYSGRFIFGIACWSDESRATDEGSLLLHCLRAIQRTDRLDGAIKIICNNGSFIRRCCKCLWNNTVQQVLGVSVCQEQNKLVFIRADPAPEVFHLLRRVDRTISSKVWHRPPPNWRPYEDIL